MKKVIFFVLLSVFAYATQTAVNFEQDDTTVETNQYGEIESYETVNVNTEDFNIKKFWVKFSKTDEDPQITKIDLNTKIKFKLTTKATFVCEKANLNDPGCSGQKPFLINKGLLDNTALQVDADGENLPEGEYRIPFDRAETYTAANNDAFYAVDVFRDENYYKQLEADAQDSPQDFYGYIVALFSKYYSQNPSYYTDTQNNPDIRKRYIANMIFGVEEKYKIAKGTPLPLPPTKNAANDDGDISLLDYTTKTLEEATCTGMVYNYNSKKKCQKLHFKGFRRFLSNTSNEEEVINVNTDATMEDTEITLLALASDLNEHNYLADKLTTDDNGEDTFKEDALTPMGHIFRAMRRFFFGLGKNTQKIEPQAAHVTFDFDVPVPLQFLEIDARKVADFIYFDLLGIESVTGTEVTECKVSKRHGTYIIRPNITLPHNLANLHVGNTKKYPLLNINGHTLHLTNEDWLNWCSRHKDDTSRRRGFWHRMFNTSCGCGFFKKNKTGDTYNEQLDALLDNKNYRVKDYQEKVHKELILHVKRKDITDFAVGTQGTTTQYQVETVQRDGRHK
jgi:hypothetical protein